MFQRNQNRSFQKINQSRNDVKTYRGQLKYKNQVHVPNPVPSLKFQVNIFENIVSIRFNMEFAKHFLNQVNSNLKQTQDSFVDNFIDDLTEINGLKGECLIADEYHMGNYSDIIYINLDKKHFDNFFNMIDMLDLSVSAFFKFKEVFKDLSFYLNGSLQNKKAENF